MWIEITSTSLLVRGDIVVSQPGLGKPLGWPCVEHNTRLTGLQLPIYCTVSRTGECLNTGSGQDQRWSWSPGYINNIDYLESLSNHNIICKECCTTALPCTPGQYQYFNTRVAPSHSHISWVLSNINMSSHTWSPEECHYCNYSWEL